MSANNTQHSSNRRDIENSSHHVDDEIDAKCCFCFNLQTGLLIYLVLGVISGVTNSALLRNFSGFAGIIVNLIGIFAVYKRNPTWLRVFQILYGIMLIVLLLAAVLFIVGGALVAADAAGGVTADNATRARIVLFVAGALIFVQFAFSCYIFAKLRQFGRIVADQLRRAGHQ